MTDQRHLVIASLNAARGRDALDSRRPARSSDDTARRVSILQAVAAGADKQPAWATSDEQRLALLTERLGDLGGAVLRGHTAPEHELVRLAATAVAWLERIEAGRAA